MKRKIDSIDITGISSIVILVLIILMAMCSCEKSDCFNRITQDMTWYIHEADTVKTTICNRTKDVYCGNPDDLTSYTIEEYHSCGMTVDSVFYPTMRVIKKHLIILYRD